MIKDFINSIGGPLNKRDWLYISFISILAVFMGAMVPVWMHTDWLVSVVHWLGLPV